MRVFVTGGSGQLGWDVLRALERRGAECRGVSSRELNVADGGAVRAALTAYRPDAVIHCAAYTKVDQAEDCPERAMAVNAVGTGNVARACRELGAKMLYVSTDYVFPGTGGNFYETDDPTGPLNVYGRSKLAGERAVEETLERYFIVRTSWVFGRNGANFVRAMLRLAETRPALNVVCDQIGSPTYAADLAPLLCGMVDSEGYGIYHATNEGVCSWAAFAEEIFRAAGRTARVVPVTTADYGARAPRPANSRLSKRSLDAGGFARLPDWRDALARYLGEERSDGPLC